MSKLDKSGCDWQPSISMPRLRQRADVLTSIRSFFAERHVMEVETPLLANAGVTDPHLSNAVTHLNTCGAELTPFYLQTSPEYAMKRLLAAGSGCIYQMAKVVRDDEIGRFHNPEFTMLEWYRVGFTDFDLMSEVDSLLQLVLGTEPAEFVSYQQLFINHTGCDPLTPQGLQHLKAWLVDKSIGDWVASESNMNTLLQLAISHFIEPMLGQTRPTFVYNFPASQAALARLDDKDARVARRFEVYIKGIELANGFYELTDPAQQAERFELDNLQRRELGRPPAVIDQRLLAALQQGLPECSGVALGVDRLLMLKLGASHIKEV